MDLYAVYFDGEDIVGFTGIRYRTLRIEKTNYKGLYLGQTMLLKQYRGKGIIQRTVIKMLKKHYTSAPFHKLIIWSNALTYRPYLVMAKGLKNYFPHPDKAPSSLRKEIQNSIGRAYYPDHYNIEMGTVRKEKNILKAIEIEHSVREREDRHVSFYLEQNPDFTKGTGLICYADGSMINLVTYISRKTRKTWSKRFRSTS